jgi:hypothetical protein
MSKYSTAKGSEDSSRDNTTRLDGENNVAANSLGSKSSISLSCHLTPAAILLIGPFPFGSSFSSSTFALLATGAPSASPPEAPPYPLDRHPRASFCENEDHQKKMIRAS